MDTSQYEPNDEGISPFQAQHLKEHEIKLLKRNFRIQQLQLYSTLTPGQYVELQILLTMKWS